jgi:uncharacterized protein (DUF697 family)
MANPLTLARVWRILKEVDLEAIRRHAETPLRLLVVGETTADSDAVAVRLTGGDVGAAQWLTSVDAALASERPEAARAPVADGPDVVVVVTRGREVSPALTAVRQVWLDRKVRLVTVALESGERSGKIRTHGSVARVALDRLDDDAVNRVAEAIFAVVSPDQRLALARELPGLRACAFEELVSETARANAGYSFSTGLAEIVPLFDVPLNIGDMIVLTKNQPVMAYRIALAAGKRGRPKELIGEIIGVLGGGLIFRQIARQLIGLVPVLGIVPKVAVAYGGTWAIGRAVMMWATEGQKLTKARLRELSREGLTRGREVARALKRTPTA